MLNLPVVKGRGAQYNPANRFDQYIPTTFKSVESESEKTRFYKSFAKTIVNKVDSPDIGLTYSVNPYQGCEHGCTYCYARPTHADWGFSPGLEFETKILIKYNAPELLRKKLNGKNWMGKPIMLSGNTDCYQPIEKQVRITRKLLEILYEFKNPVGIVTKSKLVTRDIDLLKPMAELGLARVAVSLNTINDDLRQILEPRAATVQKRLDAIEMLSEAGIPVHVLAAPIIPGLNDHEIFSLIKAVKERGAQSASHIIVRLNHEVGEVFSDWLEKFFPERKNKVLNMVKSVHGGKVSDSRFGVRMRGEGAFADNIYKQFKVACEKFGLSQGNGMEWNTELFKNDHQRQLALW